MASPIDLFSALHRLAADRRGTTAIEYVVIASAVSIAIALSLGTLGDGVVNLFDSIANGFSGGGP